MRLLGYTRVSTAKQDARLQVDALTAAKVEPDYIFSDVTDAKASDRPGMRGLLEYAVAGDTVVVWRIDRLGRSLIDVLNVINMLGDCGINLRSIQDGIDPSTTTGRHMLNLLASLVVYERELVRERVSDGIAAARQGGTRLGRPPVDPETVRGKLRVVKDARARGLSAAEAAQLVGWSRATLYRHQQEHGPQR